MDDFYANRYKSGKGRKSRKRDMKGNNNMEHGTEREKERRYRRAKHNNSVIITKQNTESTEGIFMSGIVCNKRGNKEQMKQKVK